MDRTRKFLARKMYGIPVYFILLFVMASTALAVWYAMVISSSNILGVSGTSLKYSPDGVTYTTAMPALYSDAEMGLGDTEAVTAWWESNDAPANLVMRITNPTYTQGGGQGAGDTISILKYYRINAMNYGGVTDIGSYITDANGNGFSDLEDFVLANQTVPYQNHTAMNWTIQLDSTAGDVDELNGDSVDFDWEFKAQ